MKHLPAIVVLVLLVIVAYYPVVDFEYTNWDDDLFITENQHIAEGVTWSGIRWAMGVHEGNWRPLPMLSHMIDVQLFDLDPRGPHLGNVLLHAINAVLVYGVWLRLTGSGSKALAVAALFAVHPLRVESVAWVTDRTDLLCALFWLLTMAAYLSYARRPSVARYATTTTLMIASLMSKPIAVILPVALLVMDYWPLARRESLVRLIAEKVPWLAMGAATAVVAYVYQSRYGGLPSLATIPLWLRTCNAEVSYLVYLRQMFWPSGLACFYPYPITIADQPMVRYTFLAEGGASLAVLVLITWLAFLWRKKAPYLLFGWLWYIVTLLPVIGFTQAGLQAHADRYTYLPSLGIATAVVWALSDLLRVVWPHDVKWCATVGSVLVGIAIGLFMVIDRPILASWRNTETLFRRSIAICPSSIAHQHLGRYLDRAGHKVTALDEYRKALALDPRDSHSRNNLAAILWFDGKRDEAIAEYRRTVAVDPRLAIAHENYGEALLEIGEIAAAIEQLEAGLKLDANSARAHYHLGRARASLGQTTTAESEFRAAVQLKYDWPEAHNNLGAVLMQQGKLDDAIGEFNTALRLAPGLVDARINRAILLAERGQLDEARIDFDRALQTPHIEPDTREYILDAMRHYNFTDASEK